MSSFTESNICDKQPSSCTRSSCDDEDVDVRASRVVCNTARYRLRRTFKDWSRKCRHRAVTDDDDDDPDEVSPPLLHEGSVQNRRPASPAGRTASAESEASAAPSHPITPEATPTISGGADIIKSSQVSRLVSACSGVGGGRHRRKTKMLRFFLQGGCNKHAGEQEVAAAIIIGAGAKRTKRRYRPMKTVALYLGTWEKCRS